jgi:hypothetical protein
MDNDREHTARSRQLARLPADKKPPGPRAALAMAKSKAYQAAADAPATLRAYKADLENFKAWRMAVGSKRLHPDAVRQIVGPPRGCGRDQRHAHGAGDAARYARRVRHHGLQERGPG